MIKSFSVDMSYSTALLSYTTEEVLIIQYGIFLFLIGKWIRTYTQAWKSVPFIFCGSNKYEVKVPSTLNRPIRSLNTYRITHSLDIRISLFVQLYDMDLYYVVLYHSLTLFSYIIPLLWCVRLFIHYRNIRFLYSNKFSITLLPKL